MTNTNCHSYTKEAFNSIEIPNRRRATAFQKYLMYWCLYLSKIQVSKRVVEGEFLSFLILSFVMIMLDPGVGAFGHLHVL